MSEETNKIPTPRIAHFREANGNRVVTIAYKWHKDGKVEYGATIWRADKPGDVFTKKMRGASNKTALSRLEKNPVVIFVEAGKTRCHEVVKRIRSAMKHLGVRGYTRHHLEDIHSQTKEFVDETPLFAFQEAYEAVLEAGGKHEFHSAQGFKGKGDKQMYIYRVFPSTGPHTDKRVY